jgi:putative ABC transport system permease protein
MVWKNLLRRPTRTGLTLAGIAVGVAAVVALTGMARGLERVWRNAYEARGTDLVVTRVTSRSPLPAAFDATLRAEFAAMPEVAEVAGLMNDMMGIEEAPTVLVFGWENPSFLWNHLKLRAGAWPQPGERGLLTLGALAAETLGKKVGDPVQIEFEEFRVAAVFDSPALIENGAVIMPLEEMQRVTDRAGKVNFLNLRLRDGGNPPAIAAVRAQMAGKMPGFSALEVVRAMSWATSWIALAVGAFGVANTVLMSVFERVREIGVLLAIGWKRRRVMGMILLESLILSLCGGLIGTLAGVLTTTVLEHTGMLRGRLEADTGPALYLTALAVAIGLGLAGGLYPAWRASRLQPGVALRSE